MRHAFGSLRAVWRPRRPGTSLRTVWFRRLFRFGSMDTLIALGTTIAYAASIAYMALDIVSDEPQSDMGYVRRCTVRSR